MMLLPSIRNNLAGTVYTTKSTLKIKKAYYGLQSLQSISEK